MPTPEIPLADISLLGIFIAGATFGANKVSEIFSRNKPDDSTHKIDMLMREVAELRTQCKEIKYSIEQLK